MTDKTVLNIIKEVLAAGIFISPLIAFLIVRKRKWDRNLKIGVGIIIAIVLSVVLYFTVIIMAYTI